MVRATPPELDDVLSPYSDAVVETALRLRARVLAVLPNAHEVVWDATNAVSLVFTLTDRWQDGICHVAVYSKHVNLGFNDGAALDDSLRVLEGTGARIRHAKFPTPDATAADWIDDYLLAAVAAAGQSADMGDGGTTLRTSSGPKRRPS